MFDYQDGFLHLFFCNETDEFYLDSLAQFDLLRYLSYQMEKDEYKGTFFIQSGKVYTGNRRSEKYIENFYESRKKTSFFGQKKPEYKRVRDNGREKGFFDFRSFSKSGDEIAGLITGLLQEAGNQYAFIIPLKTFTALYKEEERLSKLISICSQNRGKSAMIILCPMDASECFQGIMNRTGVFNSELCPEIQKLFGRKDGFLVFDELSKGMGNCYHILDPLKQTQIRKMLEYGILFEGWKIRYDEIGNYCDFIYLWYHSTSFAQKYRKALPENEWRDISRLRKWLSVSRNIENLAKLVKSETDELKEGETLLKKREGQYQINRTVNEPVYRKSRAYIELNQIDMEELVSKTKNARQTIDKYYEILDMFQKIWSDGRENDEEVEYCINQLKAIPQSYSCSAVIAEKIILMLYYNMSSSDRKSNPDLFQEKLKYHRQIVDLEFGIADKKTRIKKMGEKIRQAGEELQRLSRELQNMDEDPFSDEHILFPKKKRIVDLKKSQERNGKCQMALELMVNQYEEQIDRLELVIDTVGHDQVNYETMTEAQRSFQENCLSIEKVLKELDKLDSEMDVTQELLDEAVTEKLETTAEKELDELIQQLN